MNSLIEPWGWGGGGGGGGGSGEGLRFTWLDSKYPDAIVSEQAQSHS